MVSFRTLFVAISGALTAVAIPSPTIQNITERAGTPSSEGFDNGYYYKWWSDGNAESSYNNGPGGYFSITWGSSGYLFGGKGWNPGTKDRVLTYTGQYKYSGNSIIGVYGWARNPLTEYYIVDNFGSYNPAAGGVSKGSFTVDGSLYDMYAATRVNHIDGTATYQQFWSVRRNKRTGGTIDVGAHFNAWAKAGMNIGSELDYQILHCEGYFSMGLCAITV
ncbi:putative endo-1, 4-beta-xylanase A precursor, partial [Panaeolus papilionaceus]